MRIYVDMDDTMCDFSGVMKGYRSLHPEVEFPQSTFKFFSCLPPIEGAIDAVNELRKQHDVWVLTAPSVKNPRSYMEKRLWIEKHFDIEFCEKLIICGNKGLLKGDILIDDRKKGRGQEDFEGILMQFGKGEYKTWEQVMDYVLTK